MGRWNNVQRESRRSRIKKLQAEVRAGIMVQRGHTGQRPVCSVRGCGRKRHLVVDHPNGRDWNVRKHNEETRWRRYLRELASNVPLDLLCQEHSGRDGRMRFQGRPKWRQQRVAASWTPDLLPEKPRAWALTAEESARLSDYLYGPLWAMEAA